MELRRIPTVRYLLITLLSAAWLLSGAIPVSAGDRIRTADLERRYRIESTREHKCATRFCGSNRGGTVKRSRIRDMKTGETAYVRIYVNADGEITIVEIE
jgi:hypothetical protein